MPDKSEWNGMLSPRQEEQRPTTQFRRSSKKGSELSPFPSKSPEELATTQPAPVRAPVQGAAKEPSQGARDEAAASAVDTRQRRKPAFDREGPVEAVALQSDWQFWNIFSDVRTIGKGHFAKVKQVQHHESTEHFAAKILDKAMADNDIEDLVRACAPVAAHLEAKGRIRKAEFVNSPHTNQPRTHTGQVREFQMLRALRHTNIIRLFAAYETPRKLYLVTEVRPLAAPERAEDNPSSVATNAYMTSPCSSPLVASL